MGTAHSKSRLDVRNVQNNLFWSLEQQMKWQSQCPSAQQMLRLHQSHAAKQQLMSNISTSDVGAMDREADQIIVSSQQVLNEVEAIVAGRHFPTVGALGMKKGEQLPSSAHPLHSGLASQIFGAAAAEQVASNADKLMSAVGGQQQNVQQQQGGMQGMQGNEQFLRQMKDQYYQQRQQQGVTGSNVTGQTFQQPSGNQFSYFNASENFNQFQPSNSGMMGQGMIGNALNQLSGSNINNNQLSSQQGMVGNQMGSQSGVSGMNNVGTQVGGNMLGQQGMIGQQNVGVNQGVSGITSGVNNMNLQQQQQGGVPLDHLSKERIEIVAKYLFIHNLLDRFVRSAETNYQLWLKYETLRKRTKPKYSRGVAQQELQLMTQERNSLEQMLWHSYGSWSLAQTTLDWLQRDYAIEYALHKVNTQLARIRSFTDVLFHQHLKSTVGNVPGSNAMATTVPTEAFQVSSFSANIKRYTEQFDAIILRLTQQKIQLNTFSINNEKDALRIGFDFLDVRNRGYLEQSDVPNMPEQLFHSLVGRSGNNNTITYASTIGALDALSAELDQVSMRIVELQRAKDRLSMERMSQPSMGTGVTGAVTGAVTNAVTNTTGVGSTGMPVSNVTNQTTEVTNVGNVGTVGGVDNNMSLFEQHDQEIQQKFSRAQEIRAQLRMIYRFFLDSFSGHVFSSLDVGSRQQAIDVNSLFNDLQGMGDNMQYVNPFTPVVGMEQDNEQEDVYIDEKRLGRPSLSGTPVQDTNVTNVSSFDKSNVVQPESVAVDMPSSSQVGSGVYNKDMRGVGTDKTETVMHQHNVTHSRV